MTRRRVAIVLAATLGLVLAMPSAAAALLVYTLLGTPLTATAGQLTTYTLTATNGDLLTELGCLEVVLEASFQNVSAFGASASNGDAWNASATGTTVVVHSLSGGGRLEFLQTVTFTITARATIAGVTTWANHAHRPQDCSGADQPGLPLAITVLPALLPTPTPTPVPTPVPTATPRPTPTPIVPLPTPSASLPLPSLPLPSLPLPSSTASSTASPTTSPGATASATASPGQPGGSPMPSASAGGTPSAGSGAGGGPAAPPSGGSTPTSGGSTGAGSDDPGARFPSIAFDERRLDLAGASVGLFGGIEIWAVPAATIALPGLLVLIWVALQAAGAIAWIPAVRRLQGKDEPRRRVRVRTP